MTPAHAWLNAVMDSSKDNHLLLHVSPVPIATVLNARLRPIVNSAIKDFSNSMVNVYHPVLSLSSLMKRTDVNLATKLNVLNVWQIIKKNAKIVKLDTSLVKADV